MPALFLFLFKVNIALVLFCLGYFLVLRHLTFYTLNRVYLVIAILFSTLYPKIDISGFIERHSQFTRPVQTISNWKLPAENFVKPLYQPNYWQWVEVIFWAGVILFALRLLTQLFSLYKLHRQSKAGFVQDYPVRLMAADIGPFSFWRSIYINPTKLSPSELKSVLQHEQVHVSEWHTLDILLAELSTIFYWFNPGVWLMKKAVRENVEFITDRKILQKGADTKEYQYSLVSVGLATSGNTIVNHFNMSTIKKRIIMMNTKRSSVYKVTRYIFLIPAVIALLLVFSLSKAGVTKKSLHSFTALVTEIRHVTTSDDGKFHFLVVKKMKLKSLGDHPTGKNPDTIYAGKSKDGKKSFMMTGDQNRDSLTYVINGVKGTRAELDAIDPARVYSLEMMPADKAKEFFADVDSKHDVLFVTTDDSETGKKLKEKMDKSLTGGKLAGVTRIAINNKNGHYTHYDMAPVAQGSNAVTISSNSSSDDAPVAVTGSGNYSITAINTDSKSNGKPIAYAISASKNAPKAIVTVTQKGDDAPEKFDIQFDKVGADGQTKNQVYIKDANSSEGITLDSSDVLFIIDGKKAKGIKNLSPSDIKSISVLKGDDAEKTYGTKAKNGVVVITTNKKK
jgi:bla regulator protein BlaR1